MTETTQLLDRIAALRRRLDEFGRGDREAERAAPSTAVLERIEDRVAQGRQHTLQIDDVIRQLPSGETPSDQNSVLPSRLTAHARRLLEQGRELLARLRALSEPLSAESPDAPGDDPIVRYFRETASMADVLLRMLAAFPDSATAQLRLCGGVEPLLNVLKRRTAAVAHVVERRKRDEQAVRLLSGWLSALLVGQAGTLDPIHALAGSILAEVEQGEELRFLPATTESLAAHVSVHGLHVARVAARIGFGVPEMRANLRQLVVAGLVHDAGMLTVPEEIVFRVGPLDDAARRRIEAHPKAGAALLAPLGPEPEILAAVTQHHERPDGTGYPAGLAGARGIVSTLLPACDVYAAMCAPRPYRPARDPRTALTDTLLCAEEDGLDRRAAEKLLVLGFYPVGTAVELADGAAGVVVSVHPQGQDLSLLARPVVAVLSDAHGEPVPSPHHLDLARTGGPAIVRALPHAERRRLLGRCHPAWL